MHRKAIVTILIMAILVLTTMIYCEKKPTAPYRYNPFDPKNVQTSGDPFKLTAKIANGGILLEWSKPRINNLKSFNIYRSENEGTSYSALGTVSVNTTNFTDTNIENGHSYWYVVTAVNSKDEESSRTNLAPVNIKTQPLLVINGGDAYTPTQIVNLTILAATAKQMMLSNTQNFFGAQWETYLTSKTWTLTKGEGEKTVYLKVKYENGQESIIVNKKIILDTTPPSIVLAVTPDSGIVSETTFHFDPTSSIDNLAPKQDLRVRFDWENDGSFDTNWLQSSIIDHQYSVGGGDKTVKMQLTEGAWQVDTTVNIFVNTRPQAAFTATQTAYFPLTIKFDASASTDYEDDHNLQYRWDFDGDGAYDTNWLTKDTISHVFDHDGTYQTQLSVRDRNRLTGKKINEIQVQPPLIEMVYIQGGTFQMGDTWDDGDSDEKPVHTVTVNNFYLGKYEVTNAQVVKVFNWALGQGKITASKSTVQNAEVNGKELLDLDNSDCQIGYDGSQLYVENNLNNYPVIEISWFGAAAFCNYLSEWEGLTPVYDLINWKADWNASGYRLPTEAEWEYAARGGNISKGYKYSGSDNPDEVSWYSNNSGGHTHEIGTKQANELGIYDMSGNVWEWCWDWYASDYYSSSPQNSPEGPDKGHYRVIRGGSWYNYIRDLRVANRDSYYPSYCYHNVGFRILRKP